MHSCTMKKNVLQYLNLLMLTTCFKVERFDSGDVLKSINKETCRLISNSIWVSNRCKCPPNSSTYSDVYGTHACYKATDLCSECDLYFENNQEKVLIPKPGITDSEYLLSEKLYPDPRKCAAQLSITLSMLGNDSWSLIPDASINFTSVIRIKVQSKRSQQLAGKILRLLFSCIDKPDDCVLLKISGEYISLLPLPPTPLKSRALLISSTTYTKLRYSNTILSTTSAGSTKSLLKNNAEALSNVSTINQIPPKNQSLISDSFFLATVDTTGQSFFNMTVRNIGGSNRTHMISVTLAVALPIVFMFVICGIFYQRKYKRKKADKPVHGYVNNTFQRNDTISNTQSSDVHKTKDACFEDNRDLYSNLGEINVGHYQQLHQKTPSITRNASEYSELDASIASSSINNATVYMPVQDSFTDRTPEYEIPFKSVGSRPQLTHIMQNIKPPAHDEVNIGSRTSNKCHPYFTIE